MNKSNIEWCDSTWNPITGCLHDCPYCYARGIARRFERQGDEHCHDCTQPKDPTIHEKRTKSGHVWPYGFAPTFRPYRLREPACTKTPQRIFVCSMADMFGEWVPDEWIKRVFEACEAAPQHKYLFLTKHPRRYTQDPIFELTGRHYGSWWFGVTATNQDDIDERLGKLPLYRSCFLSIEPILGTIDIPLRALQTSPAKWVIVGAETGNRKGKVIPERQWIANIVDRCREAGTPVFLKNSLADIWGEPLIQEWPEGLR